VATLGRKEAFTVIELLVVVAIIAVLVAILVPSLRQAKELARRVVCAANLRSMHQGLTLYGEDFDDMPGRAYPTPHDRKVYRAPARDHGGIVSLGLLYPDYYGPREGYWCSSVGTEYQHRPVSWWLEQWKNESYNEVDVPYGYRRMVDVPAWPTVSATLWRTGRAEYTTITDAFAADGTQGPNHDGGRNNIYWGGYVLWYDDPENVWWRQTGGDAPFTTAELYEEMDAYGGLSTNRWQ